MVIISRKKIEIYNAQLVDFWHESKFVRKFSSYKFSYNNNIEFVCHAINLADATEQYIHSKKYNTDIVADVNVIINELVTI